MSSTTRLYIVRHGATTLTAEDRFAGATNVQLSDAGREQARRLSERLGREPIAAVHASPLDRAMETASIIAAPHGLTVIADDGLREMSHGHWEQMTRQEVEEQYPDESAAWQEDPYSFAPVDGESGLAVTARALPSLLSIVRQHEGENAVVVSHKATIRLLLSLLLGFDPRRYRDNLDMSPASLTIVDFRSPVHARLMLYNDTAHYESLPDSPGSHLSEVWRDEPSGGRRPS